MDEKLIEKVKGRLEEKGIEVLDTRKFRRSLSFAFLKRLKGRSLASGVLFDAEENGEKRKVLALEKGSAKEEYEKLKMIEEEVDVGKDMEVPRVYLLVEEEDVVVVDYMEGHALTELLSKRNFLIGPNKEKVEGIADEAGELLAKLHNRTKTGEKIDLKKRVNEKVSSAKEHLTPEIIEKIDEIDFKDVKVEKCLMHGDIAPDNIRYSGSKVGFVDWCKARYDNPLLEFCSSEKIFRRMNGFFFFDDLQELWNRMFLSYKQNIDFKIDDHMLDMSRLYYILDKIEERPSRLKKDPYRDILMEALEGLS